MKRQNVYIGELGYGSPYESGLPFMGLDRNFPTLTFVRRGVPAPLGRGLVPIASGRGSGAESFDLVRRGVGVV